MRTRGLYFFIGGLLLVQALFALLFSFSVDYVIIEILFALFFLSCLVAYLLSSTPVRKGVCSSVGFAAGFVHIVVVSLLSISSWLVIVVLLNATGFFWSLELLSNIKKFSVGKGLVHRRVVLDKELPDEPPARVTVYKRKDV